MKTYSFIAKAPVNFSVGGQTYRLNAGGMVTLNEEEAKIVQQPAHPASRHLAKVGESVDSDTTEQDKNEDNTLQEPDKVVPAQPPVELTYNTKAFPVGQETVTTQLTNDATAKVTSEPSAESPQPGNYSKLSLVPPEQNPEAPASVVEESPTPAVEEPKQEVKGIAASTRKKTGLN